MKNFLFSIIVSAVVIGLIVCLTTALNGLENAEIAQSEYEHLQGLSKICPEFLPDIQECMNNDGKITRKEYDTLMKQMYDKYARRTYKKF